MSASKQAVPVGRVHTERYLEIPKDELEILALESTRTIEIDEFVARKKWTISTWCNRW